MIGVEELVGTYAEGTEEAAPKVRVEFLKAEYNRKRNRIHEEKIRAKIGRCW